MTAGVAHAARRQPPPSNPSNQVPPAVRTARTESEPRPSAPALDTQREPREGTNGQEEPPAPQSNLAPAPQGVAELWSRLMNAAERKVSTSAAMDALEPGELTAERFELKLFNPERESFVRNRMDDIQELVREIAGSGVRTDLVIASPSAGDDAAPPMPSVDQRANTGPTQRQIDEAMQHPLVRRTAELFDARIVDVRDAETPPETPPADSKEHE